MKKIIVLGYLLITTVGMLLNAQENDIPTAIDTKEFDPSTLLWYNSPAEAWEEALPVGNGRLGAMAYGKYDEEIIQLNEDTYWSGGPYSTVVEGGAEYLPEIQKYIFEGQPIRGHKLFGRKLMGYPFEQQKYQPLANLILYFENEEVTEYKRWLDLNTGITGVEYKVDDVTFRREILSTAADQVILVRLTADKPGSISLKTQLRGVRNMAHSNYGTDYFTMDGVGQDGLTVNGKSADYLGIEGKLRHRTELKALPEGGTIKVEDDYMYIQNANAVTFIIAAATNFVNYKDVSANQLDRVRDYLNQVEGKSYKEMRTAAINDYQKYFSRVKLELPETEYSFLPTDERIYGNVDHSDPDLAAAPIVPSI